MPATPHKEKLLAALANPKCNADDRALLQEALQAYNSWITDTEALTQKGPERIQALTALFNRYKDLLEVDLIAKRGSDFIKRQKGQLKLDNSVIEEFLTFLVHDGILTGLPDFSLAIGPRTAFMSLAFTPPHLRSLEGPPPVTLKQKDTDFSIGREIFFRFSSEPGFPAAKTTDGQLTLAVLAAECKVNLDKTMFQEAAGTAARLKQGCPMSRYYLLVEYLDMEPEDCRLTAIDNVFLLRHAKRLPFEKRSIPAEVERQHRDFPIDHNVIALFVAEIQAFIGAVWYDPDRAIKRGTFV